mgnify:CR=1 FL=1
MPARKVEGVGWVDDQFKAVHAPGAGYVSFEGKVYTPDRKVVDLDSLEPQMRAAAQHAADKAKDLFRTPGPGAMHTPSGPGGMFIGPATPQITPDPMDSFRALRDSLLGGP